MSQIDNRRFFEETVFTMESMLYYKIEIFIPESYVDALLDEMGAVGVGVIGNYDRCASIMTVRGTWRPLPGADPYEGKVGEVSWGTESKVEVNSRADRVRDALRAIGKVHPYEEPVINIIPLANHLFTGLE